MEQFGGRVREQDLKKFRNSKNWQNGKFENLIDTKMDMSLSKLPKMLKENFSNRKARSPQQNLDIQLFNPEQWNSNLETPKFVWYGHSVLLIQLAGKNILIDPMLGSNASPIAPFATKRFSKGSLEVIDALPEIDSVLLTHDHYDHLDLDSIKKIKNKVKHWHVGLGISRHLEKWEVSPEIITEFDWWDKLNFFGIDLTYTPSRHFSGRGAFDRSKSLWGGWTLITPNFKIYWSGDGGYGPHFKEVGDKLGPFDWGFIECGQYNENWHAIHMYPEEAVQAAIDAQVNISTPVHWGGFSLAMHHWKEPIERYIAQADRLDLRYSTPKIGEILNMDKEPNTTFWWESYN